MEHIDKGIIQKCIENNIGQQSGRSKLEKLFPSVCLFLCTFKHIMLVGEKSKEHRHNPGYPLAAVKHESLGTAPVGIIFGFEHSRQAKINQPADDGG